MTKPREKTREELTAEIEENKKKIRQFENREKIIKQKLSVEERKARNHRLLSLIHISFCAPVTQQGHFSGVFSGSCLGENGVFDDKNRPDGEWFVRAAVIARFPFFPALDRQTRINANCRQVSF